MMYMPDALNAALQLIEAPRSMLKWRMGYNVAAMSFSAGELVEEIRKYLPGFKCSFQPDGRQRIADSWPRSIDDSVARTQWGWSPSYDIHTMTESMIRELTPRLKKSG
jgi:nucleoside-diphosphate-sugar epimerase